jgi:hypothetical protein
MLTERAAGQRTTERRGYALVYIDGFNRRPRQSDRWLATSFSATECSVPCHTPFERHHLQVCSPAMVLVYGPRTLPCHLGSEYVVSPAEFTTKHWSFDWTPPSKPPPIRTLRPAALMPGRRSGCAVVPAVDAVLTAGD